MKKNLIAGNWKMFKTEEESGKFLTSLLQKNFNYHDREILVCPPFTALCGAGRLLRGSNIKLGAQNVYCEKEGAYTGEVSPLMLKEIGVDYVICGHSERRSIFGEGDELIGRKINAVADFGMKPVLCVGETLQEREGGKTFDVLMVQLEKCLKHYKHDNCFPVIAYEPVWAIGTGKTATPEMAEEVHSFIRRLLSDIFSPELSSEMVILYGGSVKPDNIDSLIEQKNIDGALVGGASLDVESFSGIIDYKA